MSLSRESEKSMPVSNEQTLITALIQRLKLSEAKARVVDLAARVIESLQDELAVSKTAFDNKVAALQAEITALQAEREAAKAKTQVVEFEKTDLANKVSSLTAKLTKQKALDDETKSKVAKLDTEYSNLKRLLASRKQSKLMAENTALQKQNACLKAELAVMTKAHTLALIEKDKLQMQLAAITERYTKASSEIKEQRYFNEELLSECQHLKRIIETLQSKDYSIGDLGRLYPILEQQLRLYHYYRSFFGATPFTVNLHELTHALCKSYNYAWHRIASAPVAPTPFIIDMAEGLKGPLPMPEAPVVLVPMLPTVAISGLGSNPSNLASYSVAPGP